MSITKQTKEKLTKYLEGKGHTILNNDSDVKTQEWEIQCAVCEESNHIRVNTLTQTMNNLDDIKCKNCKFQKKVDKFLDRCKFNLVEGVPADEHFAHLTCQKCNLFYEYRGDFMDNFKCYCKLTIKRSEHALYKWLAKKFRGTRAILSKERRVFGDHKVDICVQIDEKNFLFEVDDPGHFNPKTTQGMNDIACVKEFLEDEVEDTYLIHISEDDVFNAESLQKLMVWLRECLQDVNKEMLLLVDSSGKKRYKYLNLPDIEKYMI